MIDDGGIAIDVRDEATGIDPRALVRAGQAVILYDGARTTFPPFQVRPEGACFRIGGQPGLDYALFADLDDALRFGLTNRLSEALET